METTSTGSLALGNLDDLVPVQQAKNAETTLAAKMFHAISGRLLEACDFDRKTAQVAATFFFSLSLSLSHGTTFYSQVLQRIDYPPPKQPVK